MQAQEITNKSCVMPGIGTDIYKDAFEQTPPNTRRGKCLYECMLRASGLVKAVIYFNCSNRKQMIEIFHQKLSEHDLIIADKFVRFLN